MPPGWAAWTDRHFRDWVHRFNAGGADGLFDHRSFGPPSGLSQKQKAELVEIVQAGPNLAVDGVPRWRRIDLILFVFQWQAYLWPLLIAPAAEFKVAAVAIAEFSTQCNVSYSLIFAAALFISLIPMVILTMFQSGFSASVASPGGKE